MEDLVKRLRTACSPESPLGKLCAEAAAALSSAPVPPADRDREIAGLVEDNKRLREALKPFADISTHYEMAAQRTIDTYGIDASFIPIVVQINDAEYRLDVGDFVRARAALQRDAQEDNK